MGAPWRALLRSVLYLLWTLPLIPLQVVLLLAWPRAAAALPCLCHRVCLRLLGLEVTVRGRRAGPPPVLFAANHSSYLDIVVLGAVIPGVFVSKMEIAEWPLFGLLARLQRTVFIERRARRKVQAQSAAIRRRLAAGELVVLFPEGTSDDGTRVLPFKSALLAAAEAPIAGRPVLVQPVTVAYTRLDGLPLGRRLRPLVAWYGDMAFAPHAWRCLGLGRLGVEVIFHPPLSLAEAGSRKALAARCQAAVADGLARALAGRDLPPPAAWPSCWP